MKEKKRLSAGEIEAQTLLELPDRQLMQADNSSTINVTVQVVVFFLISFGG